jgi:hypothetical protein
MDEQNTLQLQREEYVKCAKSAEYFITNYVKITHPKRGVVPFALYGFQKDVLKDLEANRFNIILKSRQMGITTLVAAFCLWLMVFNKNWSILFVSLKQDVAKDAVSKVRFANEHLPSWLRMACEEDNRLSIKFTNGSEIKAASTTKYSGVSHALSLLIVDEAALIENAEELWTSAQPALSLGGSAVIMSTPRGAQGFFFKAFQNAKENGFHPNTLPWHLHPERDENWRRVEGAKIGNPQKAAQEFDCDFLASGHTLVDGVTISKYRAACLEPIIKKENGLSIFLMPEFGHKYVVCADPASGFGADFSAFHVLDISTLKFDEVVCYRGKMSPTDFANLLVDVCKNYGNAPLVIERNGLGLAVLEQVNNLEYPGLICCANDLSEFCLKGDVRSTEIVHGFPTSTRTRQLVIDRLEEALRLGSVVLRDSRNCDELLTFIEKGGKMQAASGFSDDLLLSLAIGLYVSGAMSRQLMRGVELSKNLLTGIRRTGGPTTETGMDTSSPLLPHSTNQGRGANYWKMPVKGRNGQTSHEDLSWLL